MTTTAPVDVRSGTSPRVRRTVRGVATGAVVLPGWLGWSSLGWTPTPYEKVEPVGADRLRVTWGGGACDGAWRVDVDESDDAVRITVRRDVPAGACPAVEILRSAVVVLDAPLGDRTIVNAACQGQGFADRSVCRAG